MRDFPKPIVYISKCLGFDQCRWNEVSLPNKFVEHMKPYIEFRTVCPEVEIGLGVPRKQIGIVKQNKEFHLIQHETEKDVTQDMVDFADKFLSGIDEIDGFLLKEGSPSCGLKDVKVYPRTGKVAPVARTSGIFAARVKEKFGNIALEDDARLTNFKIREHFLSKLFCLTDFRLIRKTNKMKDLVNFHAQNKFLFMAYNQNLMREMGSLVANHDKLKPEEVYTKYSAGLYKIFDKLPPKGAHVNVMMHLMGFFKDSLNAKEKEFYLEQLEKYKNHQICFSTVSSIIKSWVIRYEHDYLDNQTYFEPYPAELVEVSDSGKGREFKT